MYKIKMKKYIACSINEFINNNRKKWQLKLIIGNIN
jgi:hypothetical protein